MPPSGSAQKIVGESRQLENLALAPPKQSYLSSICEKYAAHHQGPGRESLFLQACRLALIGWHCWHPGRAPVIWRAPPCAGGTRHCTVQKSNHGCIFDGDFGCAGRRNLLRWLKKAGEGEDARVLVLLAGGGGGGGGCVSLLSRVCACVSVYGEPWLSLHTQTPCIYNL